MSSGTVPYFFVWVNAPWINTFWLGNDPEINHFFSVLIRHPRFFFCGISGYGPRGISGYVWVNAPWINTFWLGNDPEINHFFSVLIRHPRFFFCGISGYGPRGISGYGPPGHLIFRTNFRKIHIEFSENLSITHIIVSRNKCIK